MGWAFAVAVLAVAALIGGCGRKGDAAPRRSFLLASAGIQAFPGTDLLYQITPADVAADADVVAIHEEYYGIPWDEFEAGLPPPDAWAATMNALASQGRSRNKDVYLALLIGREWLSDKTSIVGGRIQRVARWSARCYDFASAADGAAKRTAYARYVDWMVRSGAGPDPVLQYLAEAQFKMWGAMGLRSYDGTPKPMLMDRWSTARALPIE